MCFPDIEKPMYSLYNETVLIRNGAVQIWHIVYKAQQERGEKYAGII